MCCASLQKDAQSVQFGLLALHRCQVSFHGELISFRPRKIEAKRGSA
jgi:hypothetical protein